MGLYPVTKNFRDLQDNERLNLVDNWYPRKGLEPTEERINTLLNGGYIGELEETNNDYPLHAGGGWYELSNGERVQGKQDAIKAEKSLKEGD